MIKKTITYVQTSLDGGSLERGWEYWIKLQRS